MYYGRLGAIVSTAEGSDQLFNTSVTGKLSFRGSCNNGGIDRNGYWVGKWVWNTNHFQATAAKPFGWQIIREKCDLDPTT
ncbi:MAG: hypothetical protein PHF84_04970, partial [bacterium]|nr:hypothetical protein [bacterium]